MKWDVLHTGSASAQENMAHDERLLHRIASLSAPLLHHYDWTSKAITYGYFLKPEQHFKRDALVSLGYDAARRPTGGGVIFHTYDLAFSALIPAVHPLFSQNTLTNYATLNAAVLHAIERYCGAAKPFGLLAKAPQPIDASFKDYCMAHPTRYDIMWEGRKVGGAAQRRTRDGLLHQGSICLGAVPEHSVEEVLLGGRPLAEQMRRASYPLLGTDVSEKMLLDARRELRALLLEALELPQ